MNPYGTPIEITQRHIAEQEEKVACQAALVARMEMEGFDTEKDKALLKTFKILLRFLQEDLEYLKAKAGLSFMQ